MNRPKKDMLQHFLTVQWNNETPGDWTEIVKKDFEDIAVNDPLKVIQTMTKTQFKTMVKMKVTEIALRKLKDQQTLHSKMKNLVYKNLEMRTYLSDKTTTLNTKRILFRMRVHMVDFKENFRS